MLELINQYGHGYVAVPVIIACRRRGLFDLIAEAGNLDFRALCRKLDARDGHLRAALNLLESLGWVERGPDDAYRLAPSAAERSAVPDGILSLLDFDYDAYLSGGGAPSLATWLERSAGGWGGAGGRMPSFLDGLLVPPLLIALRRRDMLDLARGPEALEGAREEVVAYFQSRGWVEGGETGARYTPFAANLAARILNLATVLSYRPMLARIEDMIFGDGRVRATSEDGHEQHVDRALNVLGSGFQHQKFFEDLDEVIVEIFDEPDLAAQPTHVADMGCGDGSLLRRIYDIVTSRTLRGRHLDDRPLTLVGIDYNRRSLEATARTLAGLPHVTLPGDIGEPARLLEDLRRLGVGSRDDVLHVRTFLDHERPFRPPAKAGKRRPTRATAAYVGADGHALPAHDVERSLFDHLSAWAAVLGRHGLLALEVHCVPPRIVRQNLDGESLHYDAFHAFSGQLLVEAATFLDLAAEAGLFADPGSFRKYPRTLPSTRISLSHFKRRDYRVRPADPQDLAALAALEAMCWPKEVRTSRPVLRRRIKRHAEGQLVLERDGEILGVLYSQRIADAEVLRAAAAATIDSLHDGDGSIVQLIALNIRPDLQDQGLGDQLLEFMLQRSMLANDVTGVVGVTRCRRFAEFPDLSIDQYIALTDADGAPVEPFLRFHGAHGAEARWPVPDYRPPDLESRGYGILIAYDLVARALAQAGAGAPDPLATGGGKRSDPDVASSIEAEVRRHVASLLGRRRGQTASFDQPFMQLGLDSADLLELNVLIRTTYGLRLKPTFFFENNTCAKVAARIAAQLGPDSAPAASVRTPAAEKRTAQGRSDAAGPVAIIGMAGRFPDCTDPSALWQRVRTGADCITEIPSERWDSEDIFDPRVGQPGKSYCRWGGFLAGVAAFDPLFFGISPQEAREMDPQERLFLRIVWDLLETSGYPRALLHGRHGGRVGVYVGAMQQQYDGLLAAAGSGRGLSASMAGGIANRISSFFDLRGPSVALDTMCSSAAVAIHMACADLQRGDCELAIAGGVNLSLDPAKYVGLSQAQLLAAARQERSFAGGQGYLPAEAVGAVLLKPLARAQADGDDIFGLVRASAVSHVGRGNGYGLPSYDAQLDLYEEIFRRSAVDPRTITYVEAAASGSGLADAIEVDALSAAFRRWTNDIQFCGLGSVKSVIGHAEAASAITQLVKILHQLEAGELPPSVSEAVEPTLDLDGTPFTFQRSVAPWGETGSRDEPAPRRALINAFGAGGTMAALLIEEAPRPAPVLEPGAPGGEALLFFSAQSSERLAAVIEGIRDHLAEAEEIDLADLAYTLQARREAMPVRLAMVARDLLSVQPLLDDALSSLREGSPLPPDIFLSRHGAESNAASAFVAGDLGTAVRDALVAGRNPRHLAAFWVNGGEVPWPLRNESAPRRLVRLPTYPFAEQDYWIGPAARALSVSRPGAAGGGADAGALIDAALLTVLSMDLLDVRPGAKLAELGLKSVQASRMRHFLEEAVGRPVPLSLASPGATIEEAKSGLAKLLAEAPAAASGRAGMEADAFRIVARPEEEGRPFTLSSLQESFLVGRRLPGESVGAHIYVEFEVRDLDLYRLRMAWAEILRRHPMLRAVFLEDGQQQILSDAVQHQLKVDDLRDLDRAAYAEAVDRSRRRMEQRVYDPAIWPLFDVRLLLGKDSSVVQFSLDELIADGQSLAIVLRDWSSFYAQPQRSLHPLTLTYRDWLTAKADHEFGRRSTRHIDYWCEALADLPLSLPLARPAHPAGAPCELRRERLTTTISAPVWKALQDLAATYGVSPSALLLTAFSELLRDAFGRDRFALMITQANRPPVHPEIDLVVGPFVATSIFVVEPRADRSFAVLCRDNQRALLDAVEHPEPGGVQMLRELKRRQPIDRDFTIPVVFTSLLGVYELGEAGAPGGLWAEQRVFANQTPQVYLDHQAYEHQGALHIGWDVAPAAFGARDPGRLLTGYGALLRALAEEGRGDSEAALTILPPDGAGLDPFALTDQQKTYVFARSRHAPGGPSGAVHYQEIDVAEADEGRLNRAVLSVLAAHPMLATEISEDGLQTPRAAARAPPVAVEDLGCLPDREREARLARIRQEMLGRIFALDHWPYFELRLSRLPSGRARLHFCIDMLVADAPSVDIILRDLLRACEAPGQRPSAPGSAYRDFVLQARRRGDGPEGAADARYWEEKFRALPPGPDLCAGTRAGPAQDGALEARFAGWPRLRARATAAGVSATAVLLAAFLAVVAERTGHRNFSVVVPRWHRPPAFEGVVGDFSSLAWVPCPPAAPAFAAAVRAVQQVLDDDRAHAGTSALPWARRLAMRRRTGLRPAFPIVFSDVVPLAAGAPSCVPGAAATHTPHVALDSISRALPDGALAIRWDVDAKSCPGGVAGMFGDYLRLLEDVAEGAEGLAEEAGAGLAAGRQEQPA